MHFACLSLIMLINALFSLVCFNTVLKFDAVTKIKVQSCVIQMKCIVELLGLKPVSLVGVSV